ncbi:MAG: ribosome hibernation-promoting factor, HPF/YfiA family [Thermomicrobiales bacterium]|jgi:putative sigma-54 modulation protein
MDLQVRTIGTTVTDELQELIDRKVSRLDRLANKVVDAQLELRTIPLGPTSETTRAQLTLQTGRNVLRAEVDDPEPGKAIDAAFDKLVTQVRKVNGKRQTQRRKAAGELADIVSRVPTAVELAQDPRYFPDDDDSLDDEPEGRVVRRKRFPMKPMPVEEAIDQMELIGHDFFLFLNVEENQYNVLYRRKDGDYGLLMTS